MKTLRILSLLGTLLGLSGCPSPNNCILGVEDASRSQTSIIVMGEPVRLRIAPQTPTPCDSFDELPVPESISAEISGPDNLPLESQATLGSPSTSTATLRFTPDKQGRYHVFAAFEPVGGIHQFDLYAARDRSAEAPVQTLSQQCAALERTRRGAWLCDSDLWRDGIRVLRLTGFRLAAAGDVVWAVSGTQIQRLVDTGTTLDLTGMVNHTEGIAAFLLASPDELVVMHDHTLQRVTFDGTTLSVTGVTSWASGTGTVGPQGLKGLMLRTGDQLATVTGSLKEGSFVTLSVCPYQLRQGQFVRTTADCQLLGSEVVGFEPNVLWTGSRFTFAPTFNDLRRLEWNGTQLVDQASLPLGNSFNMTTRSADLRNTLTPVILPMNPSPLSAIRPVVPVYSPERRGILLETLDSEIPDPSASPSLLWGPVVTTSTGMRVRTRPSSP